MHLTLSEYIGQLASLYTDPDCMFNLFYILFVAFLALEFTIIFCILCYLLCAKEFEDSKSLQFHSVSYTGMSFQEVAHTGQTRNDSPTPPTDHPTLSSSNDLEIIERFGPGFKNHWLWVKVASDEQISDRFPLTKFIVHQTQLFFPRKTQTQHPTHKR